LSLSGGSINDSYRTFMHYLLKYRYKNNWKREVNENYLPVSLETVKTKIPKNYKIIHEESFLQDFLKDRIKREFNVLLTQPTHVKLVIENKSFK